MRLNMGVVAGMALIGVHATQGETSLDQIGRAVSPERHQLVDEASESDQGRETLAGDFTRGHLVQVSRGDPFAGCTADDIEHQPGILYPNSEVEPRLAADPTNSNHVVGVFQQDRWSNGAARGLVARRGLTFRSR